MGSGEKLLVLMTCVAGISVGAAGMLWLGLATQPPEGPGAPITAALPPTAPPQFSVTPKEDRLAYMPPSAPLTALPEVVTESAAENPDVPLDAWTVETTPEAPRTSASPPVTAAPGRLPWELPQAPRKTYTLAERLNEITPGASKRLAQKFAAAKIDWHPADVGLVAIKDQKALELHARPAGGSWTFIHRYPVLGASGTSGPKLVQGDKQVPEGIYGITFLNPNSRYHVSLRVNYPNDFDKRVAARDGRKKLGGDIMIHGKDVSVGCLAIGDEAAEELFLLASQVGLPHIKLIIAPTDFRSNSLPGPAPGQPTWLPKLYTEVASAMADFKAPPSDGLLSFFSK